MHADATGDGRTLVGHASTEAPRERGFRLTLLKGFELTSDGSGVPLSFGTQRLLAYLALHQRSTPRLQVAGILWADVPDERAAGNLRSALWRLRQPGFDLVGSARDCLSLSSAVVVDIRETERLARQVMDPAVDVRTLSLDGLPFSGELLPGWYEDWIVLERERQRQICLHALESLCERWAAAGQYAKSIMAGLAAVTGEPLRESAHRALIKAYIAEGNPGEAIRQYRHYRDILRRELQLDPSQHVTALLIGLSAP